MKLLICIIVVAVLIYLRLNRAKILGKWGEKKVSTLLGFLGKEYIRFNDVLLQNGIHSSQIDHVVVSPYGIFVIETKNYKGWILGGENSEEWTENIWGHKYKLNNPIRQNATHIRALKQLLPVYTPDQYISIIVFSHAASLRVKVSPDKNVITTWRLLGRILSHRNRRLTDEQVAEFCTLLEAFRKTDKDAVKSHVASVQEKARKTKEMVNAGLCPKCGGALVKRRSRYGSFYGCSNYPKCKFYTKNLDS